MGKPLPSLQDLYACSPKTLWAQLRNEHISFWFACGYLFFEYVRPQTIYPAIAFFPWSAALALGALAASFFDPAPKPKGTAISKLIVLYGVIVFLSACFAFYPSLAFDNLGLYWNWVIIYFAITRTVLTRTRFFLFFLLYMLCNFKMSQHGVRAWASTGFSFDIDGVGGSPGWFQNSGEFGIQLCVFAPLATAFVLAARKYWNKFFRAFFYAMPVTAMLSVVASSSRGALVGLIVSGMWAIKSSKYFIRAALAAAVIGVIIYQLIPPESKARFETSGSDKTSLHRLDRWHKGWMIMKQYPFFGLGHDNWNTYYANYLNYGVPGSPMVHNIFVQSGSQHGFLGVGTLIALLISTFRVNKKTREIARRNSDEFSVIIAHGMDAATIGMIISSSFVTVLFYPYVWIQAAFVASLHNSVVNREQ